MQHEITVETSRFHSGVGIIRTRLAEQIAAIKHVTNEYSRIEQDYLRLEEVIGNYDLVDSESFRPVTLPLRRERGTNWPLMRPRKKSPILRSESGQCFPPHSRANWPPSKLNLRTGKLDLRVM